MKDITHMLELCLIDDGKQISIREHNTLIFVIKKKNTMYTRTCIYV